MDARRQASPSGPIATAPSSSGGSVRTQVSPQSPCSPAPRQPPRESFSPDGSYLVYRLNDRKNGRDLWFRRLEGDPNPTPLATSATDDLMPRVLPNGKWVILRLRDLWAP